MYERVGWVNIITTAACFAAICVLRSYRKAREIEPREEHESWWKDWEWQVAMVLYLLTASIVPLDYLSPRGSLNYYYGNIARELGLLIAGLGGATALLLIATPGFRLLAIILGALAGIGSFYLHLLYVHVFSQQRPHVLVSFAIMAFTAVAACGTHHILCSIYWKFFPSQDDDIDDDENFEIRDSGPDSDL